jgi:hypothetical protein
LRLKGGVEVKRIAVLAVTFLSLVLGVGSALADNDDGGSGGGTVVTSPIETPWVLAHPDVGGACSNLPSHTTVTMQTGTQTESTKVTTDRRGITTIRNFTHSFGKAADQASHVYAWDYKNRFRISNTIEHPDVFSGFMVDRFSLGGSEDDHHGDDDDHGHRLLSNGFAAMVTFTFDPDGNVIGFSATPSWSFGDPISFPDGAAHCDPL